MAVQRNMFGHRVTCRPLYIWMPMLLGCVALASWLLKHKDVEEFFHPRSVSTLEQYLSESQPESDVSLKGESRNGTPQRLPDGSRTQNVQGEPQLNFKEEKESDELRLVDHLLSHYKKHGRVARPIRDSSQKIKIIFGLRLIKFDISEKEQTMKTSVWVRMQWQDEYLQWNPSEYGNIRYTILPWDKIWIPDITLVNTAETDIDIRHADVMISENGTVAFIPHRVYTSACLIDVTMFPYDQHVCDMWFQSMSRFTTQMDLKLEEGRNSFEVSTYLSSFKESMMWDIVNRSSERYFEPRHADIMIKYSRRVALKFTLSIKRRAAYMSMLLMVPCVFLGSCTLVVFCLPPERPDRINLAMSLLASFFVLILILVETAPPSAAAIPLLAKYYACVAFLIMASPFLSGVVVNVSRRGDTRMPPSPFLRTLCLEGLTWPLFLHDRWRYILEVANLPPRRPPGSSQRRLLSNHHCFLPQGSLDIVSQSDMEIGMEHLQNGRPTEDDGPAEGGTHSTDHPPGMVNRRLERIESTVTRIIDTQSMVSHNNSGYSSDMYRQHMNDPCRLQWKLIAQVIDRLCFCIYFIVLILSYILFFPRPQ